MGRLEILDDGIGPQLIGPTYSCCWGASFSIIR